MDWFSRRLRPVGALVASAALVAAAGASAQPQDTRLLRVSKVGEGVIATANGRISCGTRCSARFARGARITLTATPGRFFAFERWTGRCVGTAPKCIVFLDQATSIRAVFARKQARVAVAVSGPGKVLSAPSEISCGSSASDCAGVFPQGVPVTLTPAAAEEARFGVWGGACRQDGSAPCQLVLDGDIEVTAAFRPNLRSIGVQSLFVTVERSRVVSDPPGIDCPTKCEAKFPSGSVVTLRVDRSSTWGVHCVGEASECVLVLDDSTGVSARGRGPQTGRPMFGVNVTVFGRGAVQGGQIECGSTFGSLLDCEGLYARGTRVTLRASPQRRARFAGWGGFCSGRKPRCVLTVNAAKAVYATFRR
jgi:hypothetical protein